MPSQAPQSILPPNAEQLRGPSHPTEATEPPRVAIVGMGCRFPGAVSSPEAFADFLRAHGDGLGPVPPGRWDPATFYSSDRAAPGKSYVKSGSFLSQSLYEFDPEPFGVSPREAQGLDPQQRLLLEVTWDALEDAGVPLERLRGSNTAVFVGAFMQDFQMLTFSPQNRWLVDSHTAVGASSTVLSNRISYIFDLKGASLTLDTACSSSLVAAHLGFEAIVQGRSDMALIGGVNVMLSPMPTIAMCKGQFLSPDGRCKTFDASADGYGRGEGCGVVVLKRLDHALRDGDRIYALLNATGVNQDGRTNGMPLPNESAQAELAAQVLRSSGLRAGDIGYVEAHGTGTRAGDPVEMRALGSVYGAERTAPLLVGSVKTNIGHLEAAAGVAGLIKATLSVARREIFPIRALHTPNPEIPFADLGLEVATVGKPWSEAAPAHAAVNSFGYGGTNAHAIVSAWSSEASEASEASEPPRRLAAGQPVLVPISAASAAALAQRAELVAEAIDERCAGDQAYTLARRRSHLAERAVLIPESATQLQSLLDDLAAARPNERIVTGRAAADRRLLWVFTGMGPQWWRMGQELYHDEPLFRETVEAADAEFSSLSGWSLLEQMLKDETNSCMKSNAVAQPANFLLQIGLAALLESQGVPQHGIIGHSVGEVAAAYVSGCLSLESAVFLAYHRSQIQQQVAGRGSMLAVGASEQALRAAVALPEGVSIAAYNSKESLALAGPNHALEWVEAALRARNVWCRFLTVEVAYHSEQMEPLKDQFLALSSRLRPTEPRVPLYSTAFGERVSGAVHDAEYWWKNARQPVLLQRALSAAIEDGYDAFVEVGPHPVLAAAIRDGLAARDKTGVTTFCLKRNESESLTLRRAVAQLHCAGVSLDWSKPHAQGSPVQLPRYAFQRRHFWVESNESRRFREGNEGAAALAVERDAGPTPRFTTDLCRPDLECLQDHRIQGHTVFPGAGYLDAQLAAARTVFADAEALRLSGVEFARAFMMRPQDAPTLMVDWDPMGNTVTVYGRHLDEAWQVHATTRRLEPTVAPERVGDVEALGGTFTSTASAASVYPRLERLGLQYGPAFRKLVQARSLEQPDGSTLVFAELAGGTVDSTGFCIHPALLDSALHALLGVVPSLEVPLVPVALGSLVYNARAGAPAWVHGRVSSLTDGKLHADLDLFDASGQVAAQLRGLRCQALARTGEREEDTWLHAERWQLVRWPQAGKPAQGRWALVGDADDFFNHLGRAASYRGVTGVRIDPSQPHLPGAVDRVVFAMAPDAGDPVGSHAALCLARLIQALTTEGPRPLSVVTFGAQPALEGDAPDPGQASLWGLTRVAMTEHPELTPRLIDIDASGGEFAASLLPVIEAGDFEEELSIRTGQVWARRLVRLEPTPNAEEASSAELRLAPAPSVALGDRQVALEVQAVAMQAADLARLTGANALEAKSASAGWSVVGSVAARGSKALGLEVGTTVYALCPAPLTATMLVEVDAVVPLPAGVDPDQAVGLGELCRVHQALTSVAAVQPGDRVLIDGVTNSLGLGSVRVACRLGAEVFVHDTAPQFEEELRHLGVQGIVPNESAEPLVGFESKRQTLDALIDVNGCCRVPAGVRVRTGGHYVMLTPPASDRLPYADLTGVSVTVASLGALLVDRPDEFQEVASRVAAAVGSGSYELTPRAVTSERGGALERSREVVAHLTTTAPLDSPALFRSDRSYLVTGGLSGFGLRTAEWLAIHGARHLVLASRRGTPDARAAAIIDRLTQQGVRIRTLALDVSQAESIDAALSFIDQNLVPLAGIFHSAMVLDDGPLAELTEESLAKVLNPKALGAWLLHEKTRSLPLEHFVLYSSVSGLIGNPNQANYAAANTFLDALASLRHAEGLPALSVSWGALADVGVVAEDTTLHKHLQGLGIHALPADSALRVLERMMTGSTAHVGVIAMNWPKWVASFPDTRWQRLSQLLEAQTESAALSGLRQALSELSEAEQLGHVVGLIGERVARVLGLTQLNPTESLANQGIDSLMAVEIQVALEQVAGVSIPTMELLAGVSVQELSQRVLQQLDAGSTTSAGSALVGETPDASADLRAHFMEHIGVQPPYFDLFDFARTGDWVEASAVPLAPGDFEAGRISAAEAARHLAIVGSCAVSTKATVPGRIYYPVATAELAADAGPMLADQEGALDLIRVRGRCLQFDHKTSRARAETQLCDPEGNLLITLLVEYHIIPEAQFQDLFGQHARATDEAVGVTPYSSWDSLPPVTHGDGSVEVTLPPVQPQQCLGHFPGYPALPVSVVYRYAIELIAEAVRERQGHRDTSIQVRAGYAETARFVFSGESLSLRASYDGRKNDELAENWRCEVLVGQQRAMTFYLAVTTSKPLQSLVRVTAAHPVPEALAANQGTRRSS